MTILCKKHKRELIFNFTSSILKIKVQLCQRCFDSAYTEYEKANSSAINIETNHTRGSKVYNQRIRFIGSFDYLLDLIHDSYSLGDKK